MLTNASLVAVLLLSSSAEVSEPVRLVIEDLDIVLDDPDSVTDLVVCDPGPSKPGKSQHFSVVFRARGPEGGRQNMRRTYKIRDGEVRRSQEGGVRTGYAGIDSSLEQSAIRKMRRTCDRISDEQIAHVRSMADA